MLSNCCSIITACLIPLFSSLTLQCSDLEEHNIWFPYQLYTKLLFLMFGWGFFGSED